MHYGVDDLSYCREIGEKCPWVMRCGSRGAFVRPVHRRIHPGYCARRADRHAESPIKLIDFSLATFFHVPTEPGGTPEFVAPEIVRDPHGVSENGVGGEVDMWAVGILLYFLLSGRTPFDDRSVQKILENVLVGHWRWRGKNWANVSSTAKNLIRQLLQAEPHRRLTARQVRPPRTPPPPPPTRPPSPDLDGPGSTSSMMTRCY